MYSYSCNRSGGERPPWSDYFCFLGRCTEAEEYQENECIRVVQYYLKKGLRMLMNSHERKGL